MYIDKGIAKIIISIGVGLIIIGGIMYFANGNIRLFKLPGDIYIEKKNFKFYFPITTIIIISIIINIIYRIFK